jgi:hypothetical protein
VSKYRGNGRITHKAQEIIVIFEELPEFISRMGNFAFPETLLNQRIWLSDLTNIRTNEALLHPAKRNSITGPHFPLSSVRMSQLRQAVPPKGIEETVASVGVPVGSCNVQKINTFAGPLCTPHCLSFSVIYVLNAMFHYGTNVSTEVVRRKGDTFDAGN